jgi:2-dehydropantoate 2-reductase
MKVCVFGAGAIGGYLGAQLARAGVDVSLVARGTHLAAMRAGGLRLQIDGEERVEHLPCTDQPAELGEQDCVIVALKAHQIGDAVEAILPLLGEQTSVVTASNGLPYWYFQGTDGPLGDVPLESVDPGGKQARLLGTKRAIGCVVYPATEVVAPGVIRHEHGRKFPIGEPDGRRTPRLLRLHEAFTAGGLDAPIRDDIRDEIWLKLWGNLCLNPISALTHATLVDICQFPVTRELATRMMTEAEAVANKLGVTFRVSIERRIAGAEKVGAHKTSMLQDIEHGRPIEIEALVGSVVELGALTGTPTPYISAVYACTSLLAKTLNAQHGKLGIAS